jgi:hypothetical protein
MGVVVAATNQAEFFYGVARVPVDEFRRRRKNEAEVHAMVSLNLGQELRFNGSPGTDDGDDCF